MAHNPFKYFPKVACEMKSTDKKSRRYKKLMRSLTGDLSFTERLMERIAEDIEQGGISEIRNNLAYELQNILIFVGIVLAAVLAAALLRIGVFGASAKGYSTYALVAAFGAVPFAAFYGYKTRLRMNEFTQIYLDKFTVPSERFTPEYMQHLADITSSDRDIIGQNELNKKIPCGCYGCRSLYTSDALIPSEDSGEYVCPHCGKTTIISERCGEKVTQEIIDDLYEYWKE